MIVFVLMLIKIIASLFQIWCPPLTSFSAISIPMLFVWVTDDSAVEFLAFKSAFWFALFAMYFLVWIVTPWLTISSRKGVVIVGLSFVTGSNLFDIISCMLSELPILQKILNLSFSVLIIWLSLRAIRKAAGQGDGLREP